MTATTAEDRSILLDLITDASGYGHTDHVHSIAASAARDALARFAKGGTLDVDADRAAELVTIAILDTLDLAGNLIPEGATVDKRWRVYNEDGLAISAISDDLDEEALGRWMDECTLRDGDTINVVRTVTTPIPAEAIRIDERPIIEENF